MRGLNEWLERDVHDRQSEIRGVVARVEQLGHDLRGIQMQGRPLFYLLSSLEYLIKDHAGRRTPSTGSSSSSSDSGPGQVYFQGQGPQMPVPYSGLPPTFQPYPADGPVIPPVIPDHRTPPPSFAPVLPHMQPTVIVNPAPVIPTDGYHHPGPLPGPMPVSTPHPQQERIFIPPQTESTRSGSTGPPRHDHPLPIPVHHPGMGTNVIYHDRSPSSSRSDTTPSRSPSRGRRPSRSTRHDSPLRHPRHDSPPRHPRHDSPPRHPRHDSRSTRRTQHDRRSSRTRTSPRRHSSRSSDGRVPLVVTNPSAGRIPAVMQDSPYGQQGFPQAWTGWHKYWLLRLLRWLLNDNCRLRLLWLRRRARRWVTFMSMHSRRH
jgi:hypothetical protein